MRLSCLSSCITTLAEYATGVPGLQTSAKAVLPRLYERYDQIVYFVLPIAEMDFYDLNPTPPVFKHFDLISGEVSNGFVGDRFSKVTI